MQLTYSVDFDEDEIKSVGPRPCIKTGFAKTSLNVYMFLFI